MRCVSASLLERVQPLAASDGPSGFAEELANWAEELKTFANSLTTTEGSTWAQGSFPVRMDLGTGIPSGWCRCVDRSDPLQAGPDCISCGE